MKDFDPKQWAAAWKANGQRAEANAYMDLGWSERTAADCDNVAARLARELFAELATVQATAEDLFDRPALAACLAAIYEITPKQPVA